MREGKFIDSISIIIAGATLLTSFFIIYSETGIFGGSLAAAIMTSGLVWATYIILRWLILANRN